MYVLQPDLVGYATANTEKKEDLEARRKKVHCERKKAFYHLGTLISHQDELLRRRMGFLKGLRPFS
jgi:hypothetical protein